jgi:hypothetical protein
MEDLMSHEMRRLDEKIRNSTIPLQEQMELGAEAKMPVLRSTLLEYFQAPINPMHSLPILETIGGRRYDELAIIDAVCIMRFMAGETKEKPEYLINSLVKLFIDVQQEELKAFFEEKFTEYSMMGGKNRMAFAAREYEKLAVDRLSRHYPELNGLGFGDMTFRNAMRSFPVVLQWIDFLRMIADGHPFNTKVVDTSTPPQESKGDELSYPDVALILAYEKINVTTKDEALKHGAAYRTMTAKTADLMLLQQCTPVYSSDDRLAPIQVVNNKRQVKELRKRLFRIEPHLSNNAKPLFTTELEMVNQYLEKENKRTL